MSWPAHARLLDALTGVEGELWGVSPAMALVLRASSPSGDASVVQLRDRIASLMPFRDQPKSGFLPRPWIRHVTGPFHEYPSSRVYIGFGMSDCQGRPSQWANPYFFLNHDSISSYNLFSEYLKARADLKEWLYPLRNVEMICDCDRDEYCHGNLLIQAFSEVYDHDPEDECLDLRMDAMSAACVLEGFDEDDDEDIDISPAPKFNPDIEAINETVRSGAARLHEERPSWLPSWLRLIMIIRSAPYPVFWEMFAGKAGLTREFLRQGWPCGPPVDIVYNPDFDLLNPLFLSIVLGLIFERLVRVLHLGPPCSSFSMAVNRFKTYAMRSSDRPEGFDDLPPHREEKVRLGNALAEVSARLAEAQEKAGNYWILEQLATSLMWLFAPIAALIAKVTICLAVIDVCMFGAFGGSRLHPRQVLKVSWVYTANVVGGIVAFPSRAAPRVGRVGPRSQVRTGPCLSEYGLQVVLSYLFGQAHWTSSTCLHRLCFSACRGGRPRCAGGDGLSTAQRA